MRRGRKAPRGPRLQEQPKSFLAKSRIEKGLTQAEFGKLIGIDRTYVSLIECKKRSFHTLPTDLTLAMADVIGCDLQGLFAAMK